MNNRINSTLGARWNVVPFVRFALAALIGMRRQRGLANPRVRECWRGS